MPTIKEDLHIVENIRRAVGDRMTIICDANQAPSGTETLRPLPFWDLSAGAGDRQGAADLDVLWLEEPLDHYDIHGIRRLTEATDIAIAGGRL